ncbi:unnamed protein product [Rangifer tarandus platyrhynchus]|uniref:Uncharacterized protein n=2 Tax=Rangifer tarandus platyrhynchus TaxID=3082113 RepID=A0ACB0F5N3_RANTA|nr:unnamed protein product [Rangifer tarandus platyrhynchus]CAI9707808.1 unnamed protein product [Rangifer tarandus platyrhynchus]
MVRVSEGLGYYEKIKERCGSGREEKHTASLSCSPGQEREMKGLPLKKNLAEMEFLGERWFSIKMKDVRRMEKKKLEASD